MTDWTAEMVAATLGTGGGDSQAFRAVTTDTRALEGGELFVALRGERFDGHDFLDAAREGGATGAVVRRGTPPVRGLTHFEVDDPRHALGLLANRRRRDVPGPVVAVTGTNGKTATKEFLAAALATRWQVHATRQNLNNEIGVPLTILSAPAGTEALVVEAGASVVGEIGRLRDIIAPTIGVVTNVSPGHTAGFGSVEAILREKLSLLAGVPDAVVGLVPPALADGARALGARTRTAGLDATADRRPDAWRVDAHGRCELEIRGVRASLAVLGRHQGDNAMIALAAAEVAGADMAAALPHVARVALPGGRCELIEAGGVTVVNDTYNANPASMEAALETALQLRGTRPLVVLVGTMLELADSEGAHERLAARIVAAEPTVVGAVGAFVPAFEPWRNQLGDRLIVAEDAERLGRLAAARLAGNDVVLLKASRGMRLEAALPHLVPDREAPCSTTS